MRKATHRISVQTKSPFLLNLFGRYNIGEMAVIFVVGCAQAALFAPLLGFVLSSLPIVSVVTRPFGDYFPVLLWAVFALWLWSALVKIGRIEAHKRASDADLLWLQVVFFLVNGLVAIGTVAAGEFDWHEWHGFSQLFEWIIIGFHIIYFLLAACIGVRVPPKRLMCFFGMLLVAIMQVVLLGNSLME